MRALIRLHSGLRSLVYGPRGGDAQSLPSAAGHWEGTPSRFREWKWTSKSI